MLYVVQKLVAFGTSPTNLLALVVAIVAWTGVGQWSPLPRRAVRSACVLFLLCGFAPVGQLLLLPLENRFPRIAPDHVDRLIVLGGGLDADVTEARGAFALSAAGERLTEAVLLARRYPAARIVLSGGNARLSGGGPAEAVLARDLLIGMGLDAKRIDVESTSRTTYENAVNTRALLGDVSGTTLLVTSAAHMPRAVGVFRQVGLAVVPWPCAYLTEGDLAGAFGRWDDFAQGTSNTWAALHEWIGLVDYLLQGRTSALFPGPRDDAVGARVSLRHGLHASGA